MSKINKNLNYKIISTIFIMGLGVIFHFIYEWYNKNIFVGLISPINESIWEHLKLLYFPMVLTIILYKGKNKSNYICAKTKGIFVSMIFTVVFYYTYSGIIGKNIDIINIITFFIAVLIGQYYSYKNINKQNMCNQYLSKTILISMFLIFVIFTFEPPQIALFKDPITGNFGI